MMLLIMNMNYNRPWTYIIVFNDYGNSKPHGWSYLICIIDEGYPCFYHFKFLPLFDSNVLHWLYVRLELCGFLFKCLEVQKGTTAYTNLLCSKVNTIELHYILRTNMKNLPWKHILMQNAMTCQLETNRPSNAFIARSVWNTKTPLVVTKWQCSVPNTRGRHCWRCTPHGRKLKQKNSPNRGQVREEFALEIKDYTCRWSKKHIQEGCIFI